MKSKRRVNRKIYTGRSKILIKNFVTGQRGAVYWKEDETGNPVQYMWLGKEFQANDWRDALAYIRDNEEEFAS